MKNIWKVFIGDFRRIYTNTIALIIVIGLAVVPSLYAWFNIAASWDPYGNTGNLTVAVANCDEGYEGSLLPVEINVGDTVVSTLRENDKFNWVFVSKKEALKEVREGSCYAAIVIPKSFSADMMSMFSDDVKKSSILYYVNQKENAIAPKITSKGATTVQKQVDASFVSSITDIALNLANSLVEKMDSEEGNELLNNFSSNLRTEASEVESTAQLLDTYVNLVDSLQDLLESSESVLDTSQTGISDGKKALSNSNQDLNNASRSVSDVTDKINKALQSLSSSYDQIESDIDSAFDTADSDIETAKTRMENLAAVADQRAEETENFRQSLITLQNALPSDLTDLNQALTAMIEDVETLEDKEKEVASKLREAKSTTASKQSELESTKSELKNLAQQCRDEISSSQNQYQTQIEPSLSQLVSDVKSTGSMLSTLLDQLDQAASDTKDLADSTESDLESLKKTLKNGASMLRETKDSLNQAADQIGEANASGGLDAVKNLLGNDTDAIASFVSSPVTLDTHKIYPVENYGSAMAPFYSILAIWVGGTCLVAMVKVEFEKKRRKLLHNPKEYQIYLGRYLLFLILGLIQTTIVCLGDLFYLQIQCVHPIFFLLTGWFCSIVFVNVIYTLTAAFGDVGKAIAVVLMVIQVAGSGGTFPVEMMPEFFRKIYVFLPFTHGMAAMRECIAGFYHSTYWVEMGHLSIYLIASLIFGLVLRTPMIKFNHMIMEKLEETKLM